MSSDIGPDLRDLRPALRFAGLALRGIAAMALSLESSSLDEGLVVFDLVLRALVGGAILLPRCYGRTVIIQVKMGSGVRFQR